MSTVDDATATMIANYPAKTGRSLDERIGLIHGAGLTKHGQIVGWLKAEHGMSHGFTNLAALTALRPAEPGAGADALDAIYAGSKAGLRPLHDAVVAAATGLGENVELAPKKTYVSLRREKQFATVGPAPGGHLEIGLNLRDAAPAGRLESVTGGMCSDRVRISTGTELDDELRGWLRAAYDRAG
jgi:hypothetical protein